MANIMMCVQECSRDTVELHDKKSPKETLNNVRPPPVFFPAFLFLQFRRIPPSPCPCSHLTLSVTLATTYAVLQARENPGIVYTQAGVLLLKVSARLLYREHAVFESVYADEKIGYSEWNQNRCAEVIRAMQRVETRVGYRVTSHLRNAGGSALSLVPEVKTCR